MGQTVAPYGEKMIPTYKRLEKAPSLVMALTRKDFDELLDKIDREYYNKGTKPIPDDVYDAILEMYTHRFPKSPRLKRVGAKVSNLKAEAPLPKPMSSLNKVKTEKALIAFTSKYSGPYTVSDKEDGMSLQIVYVDGKPTELYTRGNGVKGTDISYLIPGLKIPKRISDKKRFIVRVEGTSSNTAFNKHLSKDAGGPFSAIRNAAGGITGAVAGGKKAEAALKLVKHLTMYAFKILEGSGSTLKPSAQFKKLDAMGFDVVPYKILKSLDVASLTEMLAKRKRASDYDIDGLVIEQDEYFRIGKIKPSHAVSFKANSVADMVDVACTGVTWNVSRTGKIIPQVNIKPTRIGGVNVSNFTGHNAFYILHGYLKGSDADKAGEKPKPIGKGAVLRCVRSGDVIPYIVNVEKGAKSASAPDIDFRMNGVHYVAAGTDGQADKRKKMLAHFFTTIGVEGFKLTTVSKFYDNGYKTLASFLKLQVEDFENIEGFGSRKAQVFLISLRKALSNLTFARIADASGYFPGFSSEKFAAIYEEFPKVMSMDASKRTTYNKINDLHGFSDKSTTAFIKGLPKLQTLVAKYGFKIKAPVKVVATSNKLGKYRITFTGVRNADLAAKIAEMGGTVQSMKSDTNMLIVKNADYSNAKTDKALDNGIDVIAVEDFIRKFKVKL